MSNLLRTVFQKRAFEFYDESLIEAIHFEITDKCNASCPQCARNKHGGPVNPYLPLQEVYLDDFKEIIPISIINKLKRFYMCGNYGDPIVGRDTLEIFKYLRKINSQLNLSMNTNGSAQKTNWWEELAVIIDKKGDVKFGIDGLEDTHHLYRKGTSFNKIIENAQAFIKAGGDAIWEFLVFRHNEHQLDEAKALSEELGFSKFVVKKTGRFFSHTKSKGSNYQNVIDKNENILYKIEKPIYLNRQNDSLEKEQQIIERFGSMEKYFDQTKINCKVLEEKSVYISSEGLIFPCCWTASQMYLWYVKSGMSSVAQLLEMCGGKKVINGKKKSIIKIINGKFFKQIKEGWSCKNEENGKLKICSRICGESFDQFKDQYQ